jgi:hypothetical protein
VPVVKPAEPEDDADDWDHSDVPASAPPAKSSGFVAPSEWAREAPAVPSDETVPLPDAGAVPPVASAPIAFPTPMLPLPGRSTPAPP